MKLFKRNEEEVPQDEYAPEGNKLRDYFDSSKDLIQDFSDWISGSRWRAAAIGLLTIVVAVLWCLGIVYLMGGSSSNDESGFTPVENGVEVDEHQHSHGEATP
ncbi:hypothetical protein NBM05_07310 [Rothia sp. AR01]|uniref:Uncharacterized protein n=1 Tax=Rothia santali TaxID=2949643 RepID=A0A9X2HK85_9MICC|nr:hypothetical protein [Rothia santali]MCP3425818.1 hypothetical protein [Rothia santali]